MSLRETAMLVPCFMRPRLFARMPLVAIGWERLERAHPAQAAALLPRRARHRAARAGSGLGSAVLGAVLDQCDSDGVGAYLGVLQGAQHRLLRSPRLSRARGDPRCCAGRRCGRCGAIHGPRPRSAPAEAASHRTPCFGDGLIRAVPPRVFTQNKCRSGGQVMSGPPNEESAAARRSGASSSVWCATTSTASGS